MNDDRRRDNSFSDFYAKIYKKVVFMKKYDCFAYRFVGEVRA